MEDNLSLYDAKAIEEFKNLENNRIYINDPQNKNKEEKDITYILFTSKVCRYATE